MHFYFRVQIRQVAFSASGAVCVSVLEDGTVWRWDCLEKDDEYE